MPSPFTLPVTVGAAAVRHDDDGDLILISGHINRRPDADLCRWHLLHITGGPRSSAVHCLGFLAGRPYITSPVQCYDAETDAVQTASGRVYSLRSQGDYGAIPQVLAHCLIYALVERGTVDGDLQS